MLDVKGTPLEPLEDFEYVQFPLAAVIYIRLHDPVTGPCCASSSICSQSVAQIHSQVSSINCGGCSES